MIKIRLIAVGKVKEEYFRDAVSEYAKRLSRYCDFGIVEVKEENSDKPDVGRILSVEGERIAKAMKGYPVALAIEGKKVSSESFASMIGRLVDSGTGEICFVIGGSYGLCESVKAACREKISFSDMTFPHTLMRVIFAEQLYRAFTILSGTEYHK